MSKTITLEKIVHPRNGESTEGHKAEITPGEKIVLFGAVTAADYVKQGDGTFKRVEKIVEHRIEFKVGDTAEYDSYNLSYLGPILSITEKTVIIQGTSKKYRLTVHEFNRRNYDFNLAEIRARNAETSRCI